MWAKASISRLPELAREAGGSAAGRKRRSSRYPGTLLVNLPRRSITEALVLAFLIVEVEPGANTRPSLGNTGIGVEVDLLVFKAAPQPLDEDVVHAAPLAIHADRDPIAFQGAGEVVAGELATLIGIEDLGLTVAGKRLLERLDTEIGA